MELGRGYPDGDREVCLTRGKVPLDGWGEFVREELDPCSDVEGKGFGLGGRDGPGALDSFRRSTDDLGRS